MNLEMKKFMSSIKPLISTYFIFVSYWEVGFTNLANDHSVGIPLDVYLVSHVLVPILDSYEAKWRSHR